MSRRFALMLALVLSSLSASITSEAVAQSQPTTVTILRRTAVRTGPSSGTPTHVNPSTFAVTQFEVRFGFVRLLLAQIDRRSTASGHGYIDTTDVAIDSAVTGIEKVSISVNAASPPPNRAWPVSGAPTPPAAAVPTRPDSVAPVRRDTLTVARKVSAPRPSPTRRAGEIIVRPEAPQQTPNGVDSPHLSFLKNGPLTAILQRPLSHQIGRTRDSITVPVGFVTDFASIPRYLWTELSPMAEHQRAAVVHDYLYWFQPCEREEADNLLMIAMQQAGVPDLQRGAVYAGVRISGAEIWNANRAARDRGDLKVVPTGVRPTAQESWTDFRARLSRADIRGTPGQMPRQKYCDYGRSQQLP